METIHGYTVTMTDGSQRFVAPPTEPAEMTIGHFGAVNQPEPKKISRRVAIAVTEHDFRKVNLVTQKDSIGMYDLHQCTICGIKTKRSGFSPPISRAKCKEQIAVIEIPLQIRITGVQAVNSAFANLIPNSIHETVVPPEPYKDDHKGVWVMGVGEPVKVLNGEFVEVIDEE